MSDWHEFCDRLRDLGDGIVDMPGVRSEQDVINGYRHLLQLLAGAINESVSHADRSVPSIYRHNTDTAQWGAPNTDNTYWRAKIEPTGTYRLSVDDEGIAACTRSDDEPSLKISPYGLGTLYLGSTPIAALAAGGHVIADEPTLNALRRLFTWAVAPWCDEGF